MFQKNLLHLVTLAALIMGGCSIIAAQSKRQSATIGGESTMLGEVVVRINDAQAAPSQPVTIEIEADAQGGENSFSFSMNYDNAVVSNPIVAIGTDMETGSISSDTSLTGFVGVTVALPVGQALQPGTRQIVTIQFDVISTQQGNFPLTFADTPTVREIRDTSSGIIAGSYDDGMLTILGTTAGPATISGFVVTDYGYGIPNARVSITNVDGNTQTTLTNQFGAYVFEGIPSGEVYIISVKHKNYVFPVPNRVINVLEDIVDCNFTGGVER